MRAKADVLAAYGDALVTAGESHREVVVLDADCSTATQSSVFFRRFPNRFFQMGVAEQDMISTAAGLALEGKLPFASTYAAFGCRAWEQVRSTIAMARLPVRLVFTHAGFSAAQGGAVLQSLEDVALFRVLPNFQVFVPADAIETLAVIGYLATHRTGPAYVRLGAGPIPAVLGADYLFTPGKASVLREGSDVAILACGSLVAPALDAATTLASDGISARVLNMSSIKPLDVEGVLKAARETKGILTVEEHSVVGGLGGAVAECVSRAATAVVDRMGVDDSFGESGQPADLREQHGLTAAGIGSRVRALLERT